MKIVTDSGAGLEASEMQALGVVSAPLFIQFPGAEVNADEISFDDFYDRLAAMYPAIPTTAQPSAGTFVKLYQQLALAGEPILSVHISSGLSGTVNAARLGAEQAGAAGAGVTFWDTLTLAGGERLQVLVAAHAAKAGWSMDALLQRLEAIRRQGEVVFTLETIEYLARGGRIGRVQALAGQLLNIKPIIHVDHDGKYTSVAKSRSVPRALTAIADYLHGVYGATPLWVSVQHGRLAQSAETLAELLGQRLNVAKSELLRISPVLGVHTGPAIVGVAVVPMELLSDLL
jgi:DegV family protein with EDD domain